MHYQRCSEAKREQIYESFQIGFSDYSVPMTLEMDAFFERFFGLEGNDLHHSFIAKENEVPVGLIMGGIRQFDGYKNMRCGTLCVSPDHRGSEVSGKLFDLFAENAAKNNCERLSLEVLSHNERAIRFYEKRVFKKQNKLLYYSANAIDVQTNLSSLHADIQIAEADLSVAMKLRDKLSNCHINWQNEVEYFSKDKTARCFAAYHKQNLVGAMVMTVSGKIYFLSVTEKYRRQKVASSLLSFSIHKIHPQRLNISMPDNLEFRDFLLKKNFIKDDVEQYEMFRPGNR